MARARLLKPGFFTNEDLAECSFAARLLYAGLWTLADRRGRLEDRPKRIKAAIFAYDNVEIGELLDELARFGFIVRYECDGRRYIAVPTFLKHQTPHHREAESVIPPAEGQAEGEPGSSLGRARGEPDTNPSEALSSDPATVNGDPLLLPVPSKRQAHDDNDDEPLSQTALMVAALEKGGIQVNAFIRDELQDLFDRQIPASLVEDAVREACRRGVRQPWAYARQIIADGYQPRSERASVEGEIDREIAAAALFAKWRDAINAHLREHACGRGCAEDAVGGSPEEWRARQPAELAS